MFITGALAGTMLTSLNRLRRSQRQARRRGRRIALSPDPGVLAAEQRLRALHSRRRCCTEGLEDRPIGGNGHV